MASISKETRNGKTSYRISFHDKDSRRRFIRLSGQNRKSAETVRVRIEDLVAASISGGGISSETARWLADIGTELGDKLIAAGFERYVPKRVAATLGEFLEQFIVSRKPELAANSIRNFDQARKALVNHFGNAQDMRRISPGDADLWRQQLTARYSAATVCMFVKRAKQMFRTAVRQGVANVNPFEDVVGGSDQNRERQHFVSRETTERILAACPDTQWRSIVALARIGGMRCPSEVLGLRWADIDWDSGRFTVSSPKTKKQGKPYRSVPLFPELREVLGEAFANAVDGDEFVVTRYRDRNTNLRSQFLRILRRAGVSPWERLFQNLRASRETELANDYPLHVVTSWLGNTPKVADRHYLQTTEDHFRQASGENRPPSVGLPVQASGGTTCGTVSDELGVTVCHPLCHLPPVFPENCGFLGENGGAPVPPTGVEPVSSD